jgi:hypothetical protein
MAPPSIAYRYCIVCDDVRTEIASKETIVGVYVSGIWVPSLPWYMTVCLWMTVMWSGDGEINLEIRIVDPAGTSMGAVNGKAKTIYQAHESSLTFRGVVLEVSMEGIYDVQWRKDGGVWETIRKLPIYVTRS